jgi:uncharacterized membrane protein
MTDITAKKQRGGKPFVKGDPRINRDGRPEGSVSIVEGIKKKLLEIEPANKKTYLELFLSKLFLKAIKEGNEQLMKDMINRVDGMPKQTTDITSKGDKLIMTNDQLDRIIKGTDQG